jgi:hypothetical protein
MRFARNALAAAGLAVAVLNVTGPALASTSPSPVPVPAETAEAQTPADPSETGSRPVPEGAPETGGGTSGGDALLPAGGILLVAGAGTGLLALRRRKHAQG